MSQFQVEQQAADRLRDVSNADDRLKEEMNAMREELRNGREVNGKKTKAQERKIEKLEKPTQSGDSLGDEVSAVGR